MSLYVLAFLIGVVAGLRSLTAPAVLSWAARLEWLHLENTGLAFLASPRTRYALARSSGLDSLVHQQSCASRREGVIHCVPFAHTIHKQIDN